MTLKTGHVACYQNSVKRLTREVLAMFNIGRFGNGLRDRAYERLSAWSMPTHKEEVADFKKKEQAEERAWAERRALASARLEYRVRKLGVWFPPDGAP